MAFTGLNDPRLRRIAIAVSVVLVVLGSLYHGRQLLSMRPLAGEGVVSSMHESGLTATLRFQEGGELDVVGLASRIESGDTVQKRAGSFSYVINGRSYSPIPRLIGAVLLFWLFVPALALFPVLIYVGVKEE